MVRKVLMVPIAIMAVASIVVGINTLAISAEEGEMQTFRGKTYHQGSECEIMVIQFLVSGPYDWQHKVPALMKYDAGLCDAVNPPTWTECPDWVNKSIGFCDYLES